MCSQLPEIMMMRTDQVRHEEEDVLIGLVVSLASRLFWCAITLVGPLVCGHCCCL